MELTKDSAKRLLRGLRDGIVIVNITIVMLIVVNKLAGCWLEHHDVDHAEMMRLRVEAHGGTAWAEEAASAQFSSPTVWDENVLFRWGEYHSPYYNVDKDGRRITVAPRTLHETKPAVEILMFGGSTMFGYGGNRDEDTIPSQLEDVLAEKGFAVDIVNMGIPGHASTHEIVQLLVDVQTGHRPAICVFFDGFNETVEPLRNHGRVGISWGADLRTERGFNNMLFPDVAISLRDLWHQTSLYTLLHKDPEYRFEPPPTLAADIAKVYVTNVHAGEAIAARFGIQSFFFWQPVLPTKLTKTPVEQKLNELSWDPPMLKKHLGLFGKVSEVVREQLASDPQFHDISKLFDSDVNTTYTDECHYNRYANRAIAEAMLPVLLPAIQAAAQTPSANGGTPK